MADIGDKDHNCSVTIFIFYSNGQCQVQGSARSEAVLNTKFWFEVDPRDSVANPGMVHPVHQLPLFGEGVELQDIIVVNGNGPAIIVITA